MSSGADCTEAHSKGFPSEHKKEGAVRVWVDGCFDLHHFGHANLVRQASKVVEGIEVCEVYVGIHTDEEIKHVKGIAPLITAEQRYAAVRACRWCTAVVEAVPYSPDVATIERYKVDKVVHGDDAAIDADGQDAYHAVRDKFVQVRRTDGVSTTDLINRMLTATDQIEKNKANPDPAFKKFMGDASNINEGKLPIFRQGEREPTEADRVVYVNGDFDLFHYGHIKFLQAARALGTYLIVGLHNDDTVNSKEGLNFPILSTTERALCLLQCRYVDKVVLGVGADVQPEVIDQYKVQVVAIGRQSTRRAATHPQSEAVQKITQEVDSGTDFTTEDIIQHIVKHETEFRARNSKKAEKDKQMKTAEEDRPAELV